MDYAEKIKKSRLCAKDYFDYEKIKAAGAHFLSCTYAEEGEDICFSYDMEGKKKLEEILDEAVKNGRKMTALGKTATYIPELGRVNKDYLGVCICTEDGRYEVRLPFFHGQSVL